MKCDSVRELLATLCETALPGHANGVDTCARRIVVARLCDPLGLPDKRIEPAERGWMNRLHENRRAPSFLCIGATVASESPCQNFNDQR